MSRQDSNASFEGKIIDSEGTGVLDELSAEPLVKPGTESAKHNKPTSVGRFPAADLPAESTPVFPAGSGQPPAGKDRAKMPSSGSDITVETAAVDPAATGVTIFQNQGDDEVSALTREYLLAAASANMEEQAFDFNSTSGFADESLDAARKSLLEQYIADATKSSGAVFDTTDGQSAEIDALDEDRRKFLQLYSDVRDKEDFNRQSGVMNTNELVVQDFDKWVAEQASSRPAEEQRLEFERGTTSEKTKRTLLDPDETMSIVLDKNLAGTATGTATGPATGPGTGTAAGAAAGRPASAESPTTAAFTSADHIISAVPSPGDASGRACADSLPRLRAQLAGTVDAKTSTRPSHASVTVAAPQTLNPLWQMRVTPKVVAVAFLVACSVCLFLIPPMIRASAHADSPGMARSVMRTSVRQTLHEEVPYYVDKPSDLPRGAAVGTGAGNYSASSSPAGTACASVGAESAGAMQTSALEQRLEASPGDHSIRVELIKRLIANRNFRRAKDLAIVGFKDPTCTASEKEEFWTLFRHCQ